MQVVWILSSTIVGTGFATVASAKTYTPEQIAVESKRANEFFDKCFDEFVAHHPQAAARLGIKSVVACIECIFVPFGTILGVFTLIVLSRESAKNCSGRRDQSGRTKRDGGGMPPGAPISARREDYWGWPFVCRLIISRSNSPLFLSMFHDAAIGLPFSSASTQRPWRWLPVPADTQT
jgi:hypothetical protein